MQVISTTPWGSIQARKKVPTPSRKYSAASAPMMIPCSANVQRRGRVEPGVPAGHERFEVPYELRPRSVGAGLNEVRGGSAVEVYQATCPLVSKRGDVLPLSFVEESLDLLPGGASRS